MTLHNIEVSDELVAQIRDDIRQDHRNLVEEREDSSYVVVQLADYTLGVSPTNTLIALALAIEEIQRNDVIHFTVTEVEVPVQEY